jgi:hypothetical protein
MNRSSAVLLVFAMVGSNVRNKNVCRGSRGIEKGELRQVHSRSGSENSGSTRVPWKVYYGMGIPSFRVSSYSLPLE